MFTRGFESKNMFGRTQVKLIEAGKECLSLVWYGQFMKNKSTKR